jgi:peptidoglycan/LPS O-acetylase OafA/YrhL
VFSGFLLTHSHLSYFAAGRLPTGAYYGRFMRKRAARSYTAYLAGLLLFGGTGTTLLAALLHHGVELAAHCWLLPKGAPAPVTMQARS